ncbi:MAG TPA: ClbS/DfsB family four-helix bundle protein [Ktedonobacteraceae bacterium]|jgi:hypothetical protein
MATNPTNKAELLQHMQDGYTTLVALLTPLSAESMSTPGVNGAWAIKDILVHLTTWQIRMANRLEALARNDETDPNQPAIDTEEKMNRFNDATFTASQSRPLVRVWSDFRSSYQDLLQSARLLSENDLFNPQRFAWLEGSALWENIAGNSFAHYEEHTPTITQWLQDRQER